MSVIWAEPYLPYHTQTNFTFDLEVSANQAEITTYLDLKSGIHMIRPL